MEYITDKILNDVIDQMPQKFDSHDFFKRMTRLFPSDYVKELCRFKNHSDPFLVLHPMIARKLASDDGLRQMGKVDSPNIGGNSTSNESWEKI